MRTLSLCFAAAGILAAPHADATTLVAKNVGDLALRAGAIVRGQVLDVSSAWNDQHSHIFTFVKLRVDESMKGDLGSEVTLLEWGGQIGSLREFIPGSPLFQVGEEVVVFLSVRPPMYPSVLSLAQGKFTIVTDSRTGLKTLSRNFYGAAIAGRGTTDMPTLASLRSRVEATVGAASNAPVAK
jgi:hypothetical protein